MLKTILLYKLLSTLVINTIENPLNKNCNRLTNNALFYTMRP